MLIFNHPQIKVDTVFEAIKTKEDIKNTKPNSVVYFPFRGNIEIIEYCKSNNINFAVIIENKKEAVFSNALEASFLFVSKSLASSIQKVAECYMFDAKNILVLEQGEDIDFAIDNEIDGVIYL